MFTAKFWRTTRMNMAMLQTKKRRLLAGAAALLAAFFVLEASGQARDEREYAIKAGFLFSFFSYVDWPARADDADPTVFLVGIVGENQFGAALDSLRGKTVKGRRIEVRPVSNPAEFSKYHLLFVSASEQSRLRELLGRTKDAPVLTVGETSGFIREGGVINLVPSRNRFQIEINPTAAERAGLTISSQLLKLAQIVRG
jgi:hypothetical protein